MAQILHNIKKVEMIETYHLTHCDIIPSRGIYMNVPQFFDEINTIGLSSVEVSDKIENKTRLFTTKLSFFTENKLLPGNKKYAFRVTDIQDNKYMIGTSCKPFTIITNTDSYPSIDTGKSGNTVTVTYISTVPMLKVLD